VAGRRAGRALTAMRALSEPDGACQAAASAGCPRRERSCRPTGISGRSEQQARGDFETAVATLEQIDPSGLSIDVSQDVFGRWCDACSCLAQTSSLLVVRYAPNQGRGLILVKDPAHPHARQILSSLGMGPDFPRGRVDYPLAQ
jgi:hypothetical protein